MDHFVKTLSAWGFCRFHIYEFAHNLHFIAQCIITQQFQLRRNGISLALLVLAGNTGVNNGFFHFFFSAFISFSNSDLTRSISASSAAITFSRSRSQEKKPCFFSRASFCRFRPCSRLYKEMARAGPLNSAATASSERIIFHSRWIPACPRKNI